MCVCLGFPDSAVGKESTCNAGDTGSIPGLGRFTGEGIGYLLQYSWASLVAQLVKNLPAMWETWVRSLGWEDLLEKGKATHSSIYIYNRSYVYKWLSKKYQKDKRSRVSIDLFIFFNNVTKPLQVLELE